MVFFVEWKWLSRDRIRFPPERKLPYHQAHQQCKTIGVRVKIIKWLLILLVLVAIYAAGWYFRPWSEYSPARIASLNDPARFTENFRTMAELIPARTVSNSDNVREFESQSAPLEMQYEFNGSTKSLEEFLLESTTTSLLVIKDGAIRHEQYRLGASEESLFTSWSVAKSFVATAIMMALQEGKITSLEDPASKYAPQYQGTDYGDATIKGLLAMTTGIDFEEDYTAEKSDIRSFFFDSFILGKTPDDLLQPFKRSRDEFSDFHYISSNSHVLSAVLRGIYQKPLADIISEKIWQPLGMEADANWLQHIDGEKGQALGYCCLNARTRDYARFGQFHLETFQGRGNGVNTLPAGLVQSLDKPASEHHRAGGENYGGRGYSYHFWLPSNNSTVFLAAGVYGQYIWIDPPRNLVIVKTSADPEFLSRVTESTDVLEAIAQHYD